MWMHIFAYPPKNTHVIYRDIKNDFKRNRDVSLPLYYNIQFIQGENVQCTLSAEATTFAGTFGEPKCRLMINVLYLIVTVCCTPSTEKIGEKNRIHIQKCMPLPSFTTSSQKCGFEWKKDLWFRIFINFSYLFRFISISCVCVSVCALSGPPLSNSFVYDLFTFWQALSRSVCLFRNTNCQRRIL